MDSMPKCVTETFELGVTRKEIADILSDVKRYDDNSGVKPELGKTAFDVNKLKVSTPNNEAVDFCNKALGGYEKRLDYIKNNPLKTVQTVGISLQRLREYKIEGSCR